MDRRTFLATASVTTLVPLRVLAGAGKDVTPQEVIMALADGKTVLEVPLTVGVVGALLLPTAAAIGDHECAACGMLVGMHLGPKAQIILDDEQGRVFWFTGKVVRKQHYFFWYYVILVVVVILGFAVRNLLRSKHGRCLVAVRDNDRAADAMGMHPGLTKVYAFALAGFFAQLVGFVFRREGFSGAEIEQAIVHGISLAMKACLILLAVGSLIGSWMLAGTAPAALADPRVYSALFAWGALSAGFMALAALGERDLRRQQMAR